MRVLGHDAQLPGVAGREVVYGAVFAVGVIAAPVIEVLIDDVVRHAWSRRVGVAVVVHITEIVGVAGIRRTLPPVVRRNGNNYRA